MRGFISREATINELKVKKLYDQIAVDEFIERQKANGGAPHNSY